MLFVAARNANGVLRWGDCWLTPIRDGGGLGTDDAPEPYALFVSLPSLLDSIPTDARIFHFLALLPYFSYLYAYGSLFGRI